MRISALVLLSIALTGCGSTNQVDEEIGVDGSSDPIEERSYEPEERVSKEKENERQVIGTYSEKWPDEFQTLIYRIKSFNWASDTIQIIEEPRNYKDKAKYVKDFFPSIATASFQRQGKSQDDPRLTVTRVVHFFQSWRIKVAYYMDVATYKPEAENDSIPTVSIDAVTLGEDSTHQTSGLSFNERNKLAKVFARDIADLLADDDLIVAVRVGEVKEKFKDRWSMSSAITFKAI